MKKIMLIFGTRPEAIKMCPLVAELKARGLSDVIVCTTGQHKELLCEVLDAFCVVPDYKLSIMQEGQSLSDITCRVVEEISKILLCEHPDIVLVHGDTTTAFAASLAAFYCGIAIGHVEAGLRTYNIYSPYPEEFNRRVISLLAKYHFAPTESAKNNLLRENCNEKNIFVTGNTGIDALRYTVRQDFSHELLSKAGDRRIIMLTMHRRENIGVPMQNVFCALKRIVEEYSDVCVIYPVHPNPKVREIVLASLSGVERVFLCESLGVFDFHNFLARSYMIVTDSGGIQEEAPYFKKPVLVVRDTTERPEGVEAGTLRLVGTDFVSVYQNLKLLLDDKDVYYAMAQSKNPYGDGFASSRIADVVFDAFER